MKKTILILMLILTLTWLVSAQASPESYITAEAAKQAAFANAQILESDARVLRVKLDWDDGRAEYEVEFTANGVLYDYEVDAATGMILSFDRELETRALPELSGVSLITEEQAIAIALEHAQLTIDDIVLVLTQMDYDDGLWEYEIEFYAGMTEYDYELNAQTGEIMSFDRELENDFYMYGQPAQGKRDDQPTQKPKETRDVQPTQKPEETRDVQPTVSPAASDIGSQRAKSIALSHAGVSVGDVSRLKVEKDRDDGRTVYEVEFEIGNYEYSYEIDAFTGKILDYEKDYDD